MQDIHSFIENSVKYADYNFIGVSILDLSSLFTKFRVSHIAFTNTSILHSVNISTLYGNPNIYGLYYSSEKIIINDNKKMVGLGDHTIFIVFWLTDR